MNRSARYRRELDSDLFDVSRRVQVWEPWHAVCRRSQKLSCTQLEKRSLMRCWASRVSFGGSHLSIIALVLASVAMAYQRLARRGARRMRFTILKRCR